MTTKFKIIFGFAFMMLLLTGLSIFSWLRLDEASGNFNAYRSEARTAVFAHAADASMRGAKNSVTKFILSLQPQLMDRARTYLTESIKIIGDAQKSERNPQNQKMLDNLVVKLKSMIEMSQSVQRLLLDANNVVTTKLAPLANDINDQLTVINNISARAGNVPLLDLIDSAYSVYADFRVAVRIYNATYEDVDAENARKKFKEYSEIVTKMPAQMKLAETRAAHATLMSSFNDYSAGFKTMDDFIKGAQKARANFDETADSVSSSFDHYSEEAMKSMFSLGDKTLASNTSAQKLMTIASTSGIIIGLLFALWIIVGVVRVLTRVATFAGEIAKGNFDAELSVREGGEIGAMTKSIMAIPATLKSMVEEYKSMEEHFENGYLGIDGDASKFSGGFAAIIRGSNNILNRIRIIFDSIPSPVVVLNADLHGSYLNKVARELAGDDYQGKTCRELFGREDYGTPACGLTNAASSKRTCNGETVAHTRRGKRLDISYTAIPMLDNKGRLASVLQMIIDLTSVKDTQRRILEVARQAQAISDRVATASEQLAAQVEQVSKGSEVQRSRMESTVSAMTEMNSTVMEVAKSAGQASEQSEHTRAKADDGATIVGKVVNSINTVNTVSINLQTNMQELGLKAESIGGVMNVISDIADQTNLLALNAAIEAARAGEAGRGFAVVADEVRKLAEKTMQATKEVGENISAIQSAAKTNMDEVDHAVRSVREATELANASGVALREILDLASSNSSVVASIATAAEEQSATSEEINRALDEINRIVVETANGMVQSSSAVQDLSDTAMELKRVMEGLKG